MTVPDLSDAQRRLLAAVAERLPGGQVRELYLFAPIRQGGVETGLAVIAAAEPVEATEPVEPTEAVEPTEPTEPVEPPELALPAADAEPSAADSTVVAAIADAPACAPEDADVMRAAVLAAEAAVEAGEADVQAAPEAGIDAPACDPTEAAAGAPPLELDVDLGAERDVERDAEREPDEAEPVVTPAPEGPARFTVYTARYRLQLKGPDRGRWAVELVAEADAPLLTVDAVVRGVQRRAGELAEVDRFTGPDLARLLGEAP